MAKDVDVLASTGSEVRHFNKHLSVGIVDILAELGECALNEDGDALFENKDSDTSAMFGGWDIITPYACPASVTDAPSPKKKHADISSANAGDAQVNFVTSNIQNARSYKHNARTVDVGYSDAPIWKTCVEPRTYRYIPNNGKYRTSKAIVQKLGSQKPAKRFGDTKVLNPEQKRLQKEIQRELRREFEESEKQDGKAKTGYKLDKCKSLSPKTRQLRPEDKQKVCASSENINDSHDSAKRVQEQVRVQPSTPVVLPSIAVPLVTNDSQSIHTNRSSNNLDAFSQVSFKEAYVASGSKRSRPVEKSPEGLSRSRSEPPQPSSRTSRSNFETKYAGSFEIIPTTMTKDGSLVALSNNHKGQQHRGSTVHQHKRQSERDAQVISSHDGAWASDDKSEEHPKLFTEGSQMDMYKHIKAMDGDLSKAFDSQNSLGSGGQGKPRKGCDSSRRSDSSALSTASSVPVTQIKYMAASGEVSKIPKFGRSSGEHTSDDFYSSLEREPHGHNSAEVHSDQDKAVHSTADNLKNIMTTKFITPKHLRDIPARSFRAHNLRGTHLFTDSNSTKLVTGGFRAVPVTQMKISDKKPSFIPSHKELDILPEISGRKVTMTTTSHRIV